MDLSDYCRFRRKAIKCNGTVGSGAECSCLTILANEWPIPPITRQIIPSSFVSIRDEFNTIFYFMTIMVVLSVRQPVCICHRVSYA